MYKLIPFLLPLAAFGELLTITSTIYADYNAAACPCGYQPTSSISAAAVSSDTCTESSTFTAAPASSTDTCTDDIAATLSSSLAAGLPSTLATSTTAGNPAPAPASSNTVIPPTSPATPSGTPDGCVGPSTLGADCSNSEGCCGGFTCDAASETCVPDDTNNDTDDDDGCPNGFIMQLGADCTNANCCATGLACDGASNTCVIDD